MSTDQPGLGQANPGTSRANELHVRGGSIHFTGGRVVQAGLSLELGRSRPLGLVGPNGSGKTLILGALAGWFGLDAEEVVLPPPGAVMVLSFDAQARLIDHEIRTSNEDFAEGGQDSGTLVGDYLGGSVCAANQDLLASLGLLGLENRGLRQLSSGELRKVMVARAVQEAWAGRLHLVLVEDIKDSVDRQARDVVDGLLQKLPCALVVAVEALEDLPPWIDCVLVHSPEWGWGGGTKQRPALPKGHPSQSVGPVQAQEPATRPVKPAILVHMDKVRVAYGDEVIFQNLELTIAEGDHTLVLGPNGCGKSTLIRLITGDHPQVYANHVEVCGYTRGKGESVWEVKENLGLVSASLHQEWLRCGDCSGMDVVASGLFDSIGLYRSLTRSQVTRAADMLGSLGLSDLAAVNFGSLSWGQQRVLLLARALVKAPALLLLDEPCQGLDRHGRALVHRIMQALAAQGLCTMVMVSHDHEDHLPLFRRTFRFLLPHGEATTGAGPGTHRQPWRFVEGKEDSHGFPRA